MKFEFATATRIVFGAGAAREIGTLSAAFGKRAMVVTGANPSRITPLIDRLTGAGLDVMIFPVSGEPTTDLVQAGVEQARSTELVISIGGGSVIDAGKAIAALATNPGEPLDYLEVIGKGQRLENPPLPFIAVPTTAGTGSEVTRNAVLGSPEHRVKVSLRSPLMLPTLALVDPELTYNLPPKLTASTGMDALTQLIEPLLSWTAIPLTDAVCREGLWRAARSLRQAYEKGNDTAAREDMALASLMGGMALANAKLGAVHGFAGTLGGMYPAPHGIICAALLPHVMAANLTALRQRQPESPALGRFTEVARILTGQENVTAEEGIAWVIELSVALHIPSLADYGVVPEDFETIIEKSQQSSSMKGNPIVLTPGELENILNQATTTG
ncbi:MAG: iron-containing alcohol dehydrogenase [Anaerolineaceae bacterium]|nr:iron-containing alcohol dehydrogenase [Anaerolineaceae bacterium]